MAGWLAGWLAGAIFVSKIIFQHTYNDIISVDNLLVAWREFRHGKQSKPDVQEFGRHLMSEILSLHHDLMRKTYQHQGYKAFKISDPKPRDIHKASVRDRLLHHAVYRVLYPFFSRKFISDSHSCQIGKGTHRALDRFRSFSRRVSRNDTRHAWVLKCDIRKFFASIDHMTLKAILADHINDPDTLWLLDRIISSFHSTRPGVGLPLGNLTSQLLVNIYMNEFDQFVKHGLKQKYYIRYADDFVFLHEDQIVLMEVLPKVHDFLEERLKLSLHPDKVYLKTVASGVDFLGWVHFPRHRVLRTATKRRMFRNIIAKRSAGDPDKLDATLSSYLGMLKHGNAHKLKNEVQLQSNSLIVQ